MKKVLFWTLPLFFVFAAVSSFAQSTNAGDIRGTVTDASGALIPAVSVTVVNVETGVTENLVTNQSAALLGQLFHQVGQ